MSGTTDKVKGRAKEVVGVVANNKRLKSQGRTDQATGKVKGAASRVIEEIKKAKGEI